LCEKNKNIKIKQQQKKVLMGWYTFVFQAMLFIVAAIVCGVLVSFYMRKWYPQNCGECLRRVTEQDKAKALANVSQTFEAEPDIE
jgi:hypothetical protein